MHYNLKKELYNVDFIGVCLFFISDFIIGTVHKAKGLEFDTVRVTDDFVKVPLPKHMLNLDPDFSFGVCLLIIIGVKVKEV